MRAADAAEAAFSSSIEAAARGALALKQVVADEAQRATGLASLEEGDAVLLRCALAAAYDACRRREAALAEAEPPLSPAALLAMSESVTVMIAEAEAETPPPLWWA